LVTPSGDGYKSFEPLAELAERLLAAIGTVERLGASLSKRVEVDGAELRHVAHGWRADAERRLDAHFLPHFAARPLDEITKSDIVRYLNLRRTQMTGSPGHKNRRLVSESTVRRERGLLQSIFERAIAEGYDIRNPFRGSTVRTILVDV
jgi:hypothetical protein